MKKDLRKTLYRLAGTGMALLLSLSLPAAAFAAEEGVETESPSEEKAPQTESREEGKPAPEAPAESAPEGVSDSAPEEETPQTVPDSAPGEETPQPVPEESPEPAPAEASETAAEEAEIAEDAAVTESGPEETAVREAASATAETESVTSGSTEGALENQDGDSDTAPAHTGTVRIGSTSFSAGEDESSHWSEGKGWKNVGGQYVALVDYNGSKTEISADGGTVTLAVAGVNRIGTLKGNCSFNIVGTGIVLIDSIELGKGKTLSLMPDTSLYTEGSAAVFLKQKNGEYLLINGDIPAILDEEYTLENVKLKVPEGSSVTLGCVAARTETWIPEGSDEPVTEVTRSATTLAPEPVHEGGQIINMEGSAAKLVIGNGSTLTVDSGALVSLKKIGVSHYTLAADLVVQSVLTLKGIIEGGFVDVCNGGSLKGSGTVRNAEITLDHPGRLSGDIHIKDSIMTVKGGSGSFSTQIENSWLYLKGPGITIKELSISGNALIGFYDDNEIGNITMNSGGHLDLYNYGYMNYYDYRPVLDDCILTISGRITGGAVSVFSGCVKFTGKKSDVIPVVPGGYASRVYVTGSDTESTVLPLVITEKDAAVRAKKEQIPVTILSVTDVITPSAVKEWQIAGAGDLDPLTRKENQTFTCASFLESYGLGEDDLLFPCLEVFQYSQSRGFERLLLWVDDTASFTTEDVYLIRVLNAAGVDANQHGGSASNHTDTSFTGSGVLGGSGAGSVTTGSGTVVFMSKGNPDPEDPDDNKGRKNAVSTVNDSGYVITVSLREPVEEHALEEKTGQPQIYTLSVTKAGSSVIDLTGNAVRVVFPFAVPAGWGNPEEIEEGSLYAVFADEEGALTAYAAEYDPETGDVSFEAEQTGDFVIVRFAYEKEPFTEDFYRALAELEEVKAFLLMLL